MPKISELNEITSLFTNDYFAVAHDLQGLPSTKKINVSNLIIAMNTNANIAANTISVNNMKGPFSNDASASISGVPVKGLYYDSTGLVHIRLT
jgi:hypothetical protein